MAKSRTLIYIRRQGIEIYAGQNQAPAYLAFQPEVVKNLEVLNCDLLDSQFQAIIEELKIKKGEFIFLLADDVLFTKEIVVSEPEKMQAELQSFLDLVPISADKKVVGKRAAEKSVTHFALNKDLYIILVKQLQLLKFSVLAVVPTVVLPVSIQPTAFGQAPSIDPANVDQFASAALQAKGENLLLQEPKPVAQPKQMAGISVSMQVNDKKKLVLSVLFVLICVGVLGTALYISLKPIFSPPKPAVVPSSVPVTENAVAPTEEPPAPEQTSTPVPTNEVRKALTISIVNASGVTGQAKRVRDVLEPIGYQNFETANGSPAEGQQTTLIQVKSSVPAEIQVEIETAVKSLFSSVQIATTSAISNFDIVISILE